MDPQIYDAAFKEILGADAHALRDERLKMRAGGLLPHAALEHRGDHRGPQPEQQAVRAHRAVSGLQHKVPAPVPPQRAQRRYLFLALVRRSILLGCFWRRSSVVYCFDLFSPGASRV